MNKTVPGYDPNIDYNAANAEIRSLLSAIYSVEENLPRNSDLRFMLFMTRVKLGDAEDHVKRVLGIRQCSL
jgi:hypothetical protein